MAQIEIKNLTFKYAMADSSCLKNVSLNIENGDFVVVCGKSGCGKTTLLRCLKKRTYSKWRQSWRSLI